MNIGHATGLAAAALVLAVSPAAVADDIPSTLTVDTSGNLPAGLTLESVTGKQGAPKSQAKETRKVERVLSWNEGNGAHAAVFATVTREGLKDQETWTSKSLYVTTFRVTDNKYIELQSVRELVNPCNLDLIANFLDNSITLTNLDNDGEAELTFGYITGCAGDVSPANKKVLMLEGKTKHALRGESRIDIGNGMMEGGTYKVDFKKAPPAFKAHAIKVWDANN